MAAENQGSRPSAIRLEPLSAARLLRIVFGYSLSLGVISVGAGMVLSVIRAVLGIPATVYGQLDKAVVLQLLGTMIVCVLVYRHLFRRYPDDFFGLAVPIAIVFGAGSVLLSALFLAPAGSEAGSPFALVLTITIHVLVAVITGIAYRGPRRKGGLF